MRGWPAFPLVPALRSTRSATGAPALFAGFFATMAESDFSGPFIIGYGSSPSRCGPALRLVRPEISRFPCKERAYMPGSTTTPGRLSTRISALRRLAFRYTDSVGTRNFFSIAAQWLACTYPYRRFADTLASDCARLGGRCSSLNLHRSGLAPPIPCRSPGASCVKSRADLCRWETIGENDCVSSSYPDFSPTQAHKMAKRC